jgi:pyruvate dehydrogenase E2 component (dihydrolipoamide acetyltransferase)
LSLRGNIVEATPMRAAIARRMTESKQQAPHFYLSTEIEMDKASALLTEASAQEGVRITATAALVSAAAFALVRHPQVNSVWTPEGLLQADEVNVGVAVALDDGLIAPALLRADALDLGSIARALSDLVSRARGGRLKLAEVSDATFTLSNLGMFPVTAFTAIVTPPQVAILATGRAVPRILPAYDGTQTRVASILTATLSVDHRALDGATAAAFLETLRAVIEDPAALQIGDHQREEVSA